MDFITGLPKTVKQHDTIMVVVDKLSKVTHFIPINSTFKAIEIANVFIKEIFKLHGLPKTMPKTIILDRDAKFTSSFWKILFVGLGA
jgi:murein L,D-transpeptidase YafK